VSLEEEALIEEMRSLEALATAARLKREALTAAARNAAIERKRVSAATRVQALWRAWVVVKSVVEPRKKEVAAERLQKAEKERAIAEEERRRVERERLKAEEEEKRVEMERHRAEEVLRREREERRRAEEEAVRLGMERAAALAAELAAAAAAAVAAAAAEAEAAAAAEILRIEEERVVQARISGELKAAAAVVAAARECEAMGREDRHSRAYATALRVQKEATERERMKSEDAAAAALEGALKREFQREVRCGEALAFEETLCSSSLRNAWDRQTARTEWANTPLRTVNTGKPRLRTRAVALQALLRGRLARRQCAHLRALASRAKAAVRIQALWRGGALRTALSAALAAARGGWNDLDSDCPGVDLDEFLGGETVAGVRAILGERVITQPPVIESLEWGEGSTLKREVEVEGERSLGKECEVESEVCGGLFGSAVVVDEMEVDMDAPIFFPNLKDEEKTARAVRGASSSLPSKPPLLSGGVVSSSSALEVSGSALSLLASSGTQQIPKALASAPVRKQQQQQHVNDRPSSHVKALQTEWGFSDPATVARMLKRNSHLSGSSSVGTAASPAPPLVDLEASSFQSVLQAQPFVKRVRDAVAAAASMGHPSVSLGGGGWDVPTGGGGVVQNNLPDHLRALHHGSRNNPLATTASSSESSPLTVHQLSPRKQQRHRQKPPLHASAAADFHSGKENGDGSVAGLHGESNHSDSGRMKAKGDGKGHSGLVARLRTWLGVGGQED